MKRYGLIGYPLGHSFSKGYFEEKFKKEGLFDYTYELFPISTIKEIRGLLWERKDLKGFNVTIPYKEEVIPYLDEVDDAALKVGAVNTVKIVEGKLIGYNTDIYGFEQSLLKFLNEHDSVPFPKRALILGTGGAAKAVAFVLSKLKIEFIFVSRKQKKDYICYEDVSEAVMNNHQLIINTTPLGMYPDNLRFPVIPYHLLNKEHFLFDLIYNPSVTEFMRFGIAKGSAVKNGLEMLHLQAEQAWKIWLS